MLHRFSQKQPQYAWSGLLQVLICGLFFGIPIDETGNKGYSNCDPDLENATEEEGDERYP